MSKQEHDKDEQRAPSGAGKGVEKDTASVDEASKPSSGSTPASSDKPAESSGDTPAATPPGGDTPPGKSASPGSDQGAAQPATASKESTDSKASRSGKVAGGGKSTRTDTRPSSTGGAAKAPASGGAGSGAKSSPAGGGRDGGGKAGAIALVLVVIVVLVVAVGGWWGWQQLQKQQQQLARVESNANAISQLDSQLGERGQQRQQGLQAIRGDFQQYRQQMNATLDKVLKQLASKQQTDPSEWRFAEVEYLLRLANQRLQLERDVTGATSLLQTADERLAQIDNPALTAVRRAVQSEIAELDSVPQIDRTGLYLELMAQQQQLAKLPLQQDVQQQAAEAGDTSPMSGGWKQQLSRFGQELKDLVVVRKHDQALEALVTPEQESYLRQNVRLQLEQAQLALLQSDSKLYRASLDKASKLIEGYYDTDSQGVSASLKRLGTLRDKTIHPELPDISASLETLRDFMERRHDAGSDAA